MASRPYTYSGQGFSLQRDKNRFVLPAQFSSTLKESSGKPIVCLARHDRWKCLIGYGLSRVAEFPEMIDREEARAIGAGKDFDPEKRAFDLHKYYEVPFDGSGRFVMPEDLTTLGKVGGQLYFQGAGQFFTAWAPDQLEAMGEGWEDAQLSCSNLAAKERTRAKRK